MNVKAKCRYDYESVKALVHTSFFKRRNPKTVFILLLIIGIIFLLKEIIIGFSQGIESMSGLIIIAALCWIYLSVFMYWLMPKKQYKALCKMENMVNEYTFCDNVIKVTSINATYNGGAEIKYSMIPKVIETSKYLFVFQNKNQAFVVDKSTITDGTVDDIRAKLAPMLGKKYIRCKY